MTDHIDSDFFDIFPWDKNFETGIGIIDEQHKKLVHILNQLAAHLANRSHEVILEQIYQELTEYADYHFKTEEEIWSKYLKEENCYAEHQQIHKSFISQVTELKQLDVDKPLDLVIQDIVSFLSKWLAYHILDSDKRLAKVVLAIESGRSLEQAKVIANDQMSGSMQVLINTVLKMYDSLSTRTLDLMREKALRKEAEDALTLSEERWKFILAGGGEGIWDWDVQHNKTFNSLSNKLAWSNENTTIHPQDIQRVEADLRDHLDGKTKFYINKHRVLQKNGSWSWMLTRGKVVTRDENGNALRMVGTHSDVTKRELATLIFQYSSQAMFIADANNEIISINPAFSTVTGYSEKETVGKNPRFLSSGKHDEQFYKNMWQSINSVGYWIGEIWNKRKSGEVYPEVLCINTVLDHNGLIDHYLALFTDITDSKKELLRTDLIDQLLMETIKTINADDLLCKSLDLLISNELLGISNQGAVFKALEPESALKLLHAINLPEAISQSCTIITDDISHCDRTGEVQDFGNVDKKIDKFAINLNKIIPNEHYTIPIKLNEKVSYVIMLALKESTPPDPENGKFINTVVEILENALKRLDSEEQLRLINVRLEDRVEQRTKELAIAVEQANQANLSKSEFLAHISHELRTPMHGILSFASFGINNSDSVPRKKLNQYFVNIDTSGKRLLTLLNDLLDLSKLEAGKMELNKNEANLAMILESCRLEQSQRMIDLGINLQVNQPSSPVTGVFDVLRIGQVITNLLSNAIKFSPQNGEIKVVMDKNDKDEIYFSMQDQGPGVPESELKKIFDSFAQSSKTDTVKKGTGLGLAISQKIIEGHQGRIWAENNTAEGGAIFKFVIPG